MKDTILTLDKEKIVLLNTIKSIAHEIEDIKKGIQKMLKESDRIENEIKNIKTGILICQKRTDEAKLDMKKNDKRIESLNRQMEHLKIIYDNHQLGMTK